MDHSKERIGYKEIRVQGPSSSSNKSPWFFNSFPNKPWFLRVCSTRLLKTLWEKEKLLVTSNFSFSPQCFLPFSRTFRHFHQYQIVVCKTFSAWKSLIFVVWERVNMPSVKHRYTQGYLWVSDQFTSSWVGNARCLKNSQLGWVSNLGPQD